MKNLFIFCSFILMMAALIACSNDEGVAGHDDKTGKIDSANAETSFEKVTAGRYWIENECYAYNDDDIVDYMHNYCTSSGYECLSWEFKKGKSLRWYHYNTAVGKPYIEDYKYLFDEDKSVIQLIGNKKYHITILYYDEKEIRLRIEDFDTFLHILRPMVNIEIEEINKLFNKE